MVSSCDAELVSSNDKETAALSENIEVFDMGSGNNVGSELGTLLVDENVECLNPPVSDDNGSESAVGEEQCDNAKVSRIQLKRKRKEEKWKALITESNSEIALVNNKSSNEGDFCPQAETESKILGENGSVDVEMASSSCVDVKPGENEALVIPAKEDNVVQFPNLSLERPAIVRSSKKLLILDVNGLLVDIVSHVSYGFKPDVVISMKSVFKRPHCDDFLNFCFERFNVGVWSSRVRRNVEMSIDFLVGDSKHKLLFCWDQSHCTDTGYTTVENRDKPLVLKEIRKLWENVDNSLPWRKGDYDESNTLMIDDSPYKALCNPAHTAIFPHSYRYKDRNDSSLGPGGDLRMYLERLADAENVQEFVAKNPFGKRAITESNASWGFYSKIINVNSSQSQDVAGSSVS